MLLWVIGVEFNDTCTVSGKGNVFRVIPRLHGWVYKTLRLSLLVVEHSVVVATARLNPMGSQFLIPVLWNLCSESVGHKLWTPTLVVRVRIPFGWNTYFLFNTDIVNFMWKTDEEEAKSIVLLIFWRCLNCQWMRDNGFGQKFLFRGSWNRIFFQPVF